MNDGGGGGGGYGGSKYYYLSKIHKLKDIMSFLSKSVYIRVTLIHFVITVTRQITLNMKFKTN